MARRKKTDEPAQDNLTNDADDNFGLPEIEYEPLNREDEVVEEEPVRETTTTTTTTSYEPAATVESERPPLEEEPAPIEEDITPDDPYTARYGSEDEDESSPVWPKVLGIALVLVLLGGGAYYYFGIYKPHQAELAEAKQRAEAAKLEADRKEAERQAELKRIEDEKRRADSLANAKPAVGAIERLTERTGRYYVVVASGIDDDLLMDFANKLIHKGYSCMLIPQHGKVNYNRLAIDVKDSYADAQTTADGLKGGDFGNEIWVVKY